MKPFKFLSRNKDTIEYRNENVSSRWFCENAGIINWLENPTSILFFMDRNESDENVISTKMITVQPHRFESYFRFMMYNSNNYIWVYDITVIDSQERFDIHNHNYIPNDVPIIIRLHIENGG